MKIFPLEVNSALVCNTLTVRSAAEFCSAFYVRPEKSKVLRNKKASFVRKKITRIKIVSRLLGNTPKLDLANLFH